MERQRDMPAPPRPATILVVDDDTEIAELMRDFLVSAGFVVITAEDGATARTMLDTTAVDCLLLDVMMPGQSGFDLCRQVRETRDLPVLFLSARESDMDKIRGLSLGGDDYIVKTATPAEVVARVQAVLRRYQRGEPSPTALDFGRLAIDVRAREVSVAGRTVPFTAREFDLLRLLAEHPRQVFTRDGLFERFWGEFGDRHTVTVHIGRIREKIEVNPARPAYIITVWGVGYRFEGKQQ